MSNTHEKIDKIVKDVQEFRESVGDRDTYDFMSYLERALKQLKEDVPA